MSLILQFCQLCTSQYIIHTIWNLHLFNEIKWHTVFSLVQQWIDKKFENLKLSSKTISRSLNSNESFIFTSEMRLQTKGNSTYCIAVDDKPLFQSITLVLIHCIWRSCFCWDYPVENLYLVRGRKQGISEPRRKLYLQ